MNDVFKTDLQLVFANQGSETSADLVCSGNGLEAVSGIDNLAQALTLRLLVDQGELTQLAHPRYGSRLRELVGETLDKANLELMRRYIKQTLLNDPRVAEVVQVKVEIRPATLGIVDVRAIVKAVSGESTQIGVSLNAI
jgi:phage baseplate assembly protein W